MKCGHVLGYQEFEGARVLCCSCAPPQVEPLRIGLIQPDGSIQTKWDILKDICDTNRAADEMAGLEWMNAAWPDGGWELADPGPVDGDGWPFASKEWKGVLGWNSFCSGISNTRRRSVV
jgi:hypothetical protein